MAGYRGSHPQHSYGQQVLTMVRTLVNEQGIINVVSHINTLWGK